MRLFEICILYSKIRLVGMGDTSFFKSIQYQGFLGVSIPNFDTDTIKFERLAKFYCYILSLMVLDNCGEFLPEHN